MAHTPQPELHAHHEGALRRDTLARTGPLFVLLIAMLVVYGLAVLTGATTSTGVLIVAIVLLFLVTYGVVAGTVHMIKQPPEDGEEEHQQGSSHAH